MKNTILVLTAILLLSACGPFGKVAVQTAPTPEDLQAIQSAGGSFARGTYTELKEACRIYAGLYAKPSIRGRIAADYFRAAFLLMLRQKELGIGEAEMFIVAEQLTKENPSLAGYRIWMDLAKGINPRIRGVVKDYVLGVIGGVLGEESQRRQAELLARAPSDEWTAYFYLSLACPNKSPYDKAEDRTTIRAAFPQSILINYRTAFCAEIVTERFDEVLKANPEFWEAYGFRAEAAMGRGELLTAEKDLLIASEHIPESAYYNILLASIYFFTEEFEQSITYCNKAIALSPEYRDAFLTKAICLSQLGRYPEAIGVLDRIIQMQYYLQGESHYWSAWNYHSLNDLGTAQIHIESAKKTLPTNSEVFGLAGTIALENKELDRAEKDFKEALTYNANNHEALFGLAQISEKREKWLEADGYYEKAAEVMVANETALKSKIDEIKASGMTAARTAKMLAKKEAQLRISAVTKATAYFNAAAALANAGRIDAARAMAARAGEHPQLKAKVAELLEKIK